MPIEWIASCVLSGEKRRLCKAVSDAKLILAKSVKQQLASGAGISLGHEMVDRTIFSTPEPVVTYDRLSDENATDPIPVKAGYVMLGNMGVPLGFPSTILYKRTPFE